MTSKAVTFLIDMLKTHSFERRARDNNEDDGYYGLVKSTPWNVEYESSRSSDSRRRGGSSICKMETESKNISLANTLVLPQTYEYPQKPCFPILSLFASLEAYGWYHVETSD